MPFMLDYIQLWKNEEAQKSLKKAGFVQFAVRAFPGRGSPPIPLGTSARAPFFRESGPGYRAGFAERQ